MTQRELSMQDYVAMLRRRWVLIVAATVLGPVLFYGLAKVLPKRYKSQTLVLVAAPAVSADLVKPVDTADMSQRLSSMQQQILSRSRLEPLIRQLDLFPADAGKPMEEQVQKLQKAIEVTPVQAMAETRANNLPGFFVNVTLDTPDKAQRVCTTITSMFIDENVRLRQKTTDDTTQFLAGQLTEAKQKLDEQDAKLAAFKTRYIGSMPDEQKNNLDLLSGLSSQLDAATQALARAQQDKGFAESMLSQQTAAWQASLDGTSAETPEQQLAPLQAELARLQARYTDSHPDVVKTKAAIAALKKKIADAQLQKGGDSEKLLKSSDVEPQQIAQLRAQIHTFEQVIAERTKEQDQIKEQIRVLQARVQNSPLIEQQFKQLTRDYQTALEFYNDLLKKRDQSAMASDLERRQEGDQFRVLDPPNLPDKPSFPNDKLFVGAGFMGGLGLGVGLALLFEMQNTSFRRESDVEAVLRLPVLALIPAIKPLPMRPVRLPVKSPAPDRKVSAGVR